jgi:hypothetical protein
MEDRASICLVAELQEAGGSLRVQGAELPGYGPTWVRSDPAQKVFMRWVLDTVVTFYDNRLRFPKMLKGLKRRIGGSLFIYSPHVYTILTWHIQIMTEYIVLPGRKS